MVRHSESKSCISFVYTYGPNELMNATMGALDAHTTMSTQALNSPAVQTGIREVLLNHAGLWEALRAAG